MPPGITLQTVTNQFLADYLTDLSVASRDNLFMAKMLSTPKKWKGSQMLFPKL